MGDKKEHITLLVVDDNDLNRLTYCTFLHRLGIRTIEASTGKSAVELAMTEKVDLILMDIQMPIMGGVAAMQVLREKGLTTPIIAMTGHSLIDLNSELHPAGFSAYLQKPIEIELLFATLKKWLPEGALPLFLSTDLVKDPPATPPFVIAGVDVESGLRRTAGNQQLYCKHLKSFLLNFLDFETKIIAKLARGQQEEAIRLAHTLKGTAGNLGASMLYSLTMTFEKTLLSEKYQGDLAKINHEIKRLCAIIAKLDLTTKEVESKLPLGSKAQLRGILSQLIDPLDNHQVNEINPLRDQLQQYQWPERVLEPLQTLYLFLQSYQHKDAHGQVKMLLATLGEFDE